MVSRIGVVGSLALGLVLGVLTLADATVIVYPNAYHDFDDTSRPRFERPLVTGKHSEGLVELDRFTAKIRSTG